MSDTINLVLFSGTDDKLQAAAVLTAGAAALGRPVKILLQYWALDAFRADRLMADHGLAPEAGDAGRAADIERQAHTIKGASANVGGEVLRETAFEMEKAGKAGDLVALKTLLPEMQKRFARLKEAMELDAEPGEEWPCAS